MMGAVAYGWWGRSHWGQVLKGVWSTGFATVTALKGGREEGGLRGGAVHGGGGGWGAEAGGDAEDAVVRVTRHKQRSVGGTGTSGNLLGGGGLQSQQMCVGEGGGSGSVSVPANVILGLWKSIA